METLCPKCRKKYVVPDSSVNKKARCKNDSCREVFTIVARAESTPLSAKPVTPAAPAAASRGVGSPAAANLLDTPSSLFDELPQTEFPAVVLTNYKAPQRKGKSALATIKSNSLALKLGGAIAAVLVVACLLVMLIIHLVGSGSAGSAASVGGSAGGSGVPEWASCYIPENAQLIAYVNLDQLRSSEVVAEISKLANNQPMPIGGGFSISDISEAFVARCGFGPNDQPLAVIRTKTDRPLKDLLPIERRGQPTLNFMNVEYVEGGKTPAGKEMLAKTGDRTFCIAPTEDMLKGVIGRLGRKERAKLDARLQTALDAVAGGNLYVAGINLKNDQIPFAIEMFHARVSATSSVQVEATADVADANGAQFYKTQIDQQLAKISMMASATKRPEFQALVSAVKVRQNGKELSCEATWQNQDIMALVNLAKASPNMFPGAPGGNAPYQGPPSGIPPGPPFRSM